MIALRGYQDTGVVNLRRCLAEGFSSPLLVLPTGGGKTVMFCYIAARVSERGKRIAVLVHREELVEQVSRTLGQFDVKHGVICAAAPYDRRPPVHVASVMTLARRLDRVAVPDLVIVDEAHHAIQSSTWGKCLRHWREENPKLAIIGVTATPERLSGEGLGETFDTMVLGPTTRELIDIGALSEYRLFAPRLVDTSSLHTRAGDFIRGEAAALLDKPAIIGDAVSHYRRLCDGLPAIAFCVSVEHAKHTAERFQSAGYRSFSIDGAMDKEIRRSIVRDFGRGAINVLTSCDLISEGFDVPGTHAAILLRPTQSLSLYLQQVGRCLRPAPGKERALILDHVGNSDRHGLPDSPREWSLEGRIEKRRREETGEMAPSIRQCPKCYAVSAAAARRCRDCGVAFEIEHRKVEELDGELREIEIERARREAQQAQAQAATIETLVALGRTRGYKNPEAWAGHVWEARKRKGRVSA